MGFPNPFGGSKGDKAAGSEAASSSVQNSPGFSLKPEASPAPSHTMATALDAAAADQAQASSVFEFGPVVHVGDSSMRGVCIGDDPDAIQACCWSVEPVQGNSKEKTHLYRIEF